MLSIEDAQTILNKNYHDLTKAQKSQLIKLNQQISKLFMHQIIYTTP